MTYTRSRLASTTELYQDEIETLNKFLNKHSHEEPDNIAPTKFILKFAVTSVATIPLVECWCGVEEMLACDERYDNI